MCAQYLLLWEPVPAAEYESLDLSGPVASRTVHALPQSWSSEFSAYLQSSFGYYRAVRAPKLCFVAICDGVLQSFTYAQHVTLRHDAYIQGPQEAGLTKLLLLEPHVRRGVAIANYKAHFVYDEQILLGAKKGEANDPFDSLRLQYLSNTKPEKMPIAEFVKRAVAAGPKERFVGIYETADVVRWQDGVNLQMVQDVSQLKQDVSQLKQDVSQLKQDVSQLKQDMGEMKEMMHSFKETQELILSILCAHEPFRSEMDRRKRKRDSDEDVPLPKRAKIEAPATN